jgi:ribosomal protein L32E
MDTTNNADHLEVSKKGGQQTLRKHGKQHYSKIAKERWRKEKARDSTKQRSVL